jgi:hypothetical protein
MTRESTGEQAFAQRGRRRNLVIGGVAIAAVLLVGTPIAIKMRSSSSDDPSKPAAGNGATATGTTPEGAPPAQPGAAPVGGGGAEAAAESAAPDLAAVMFPKNGPVEVFWRSPSGGLGHAKLDGGAWRSPESTGSGVATPPSAVISGDTVHTFWKGTDQQLWTRKYSRTGGWAEAVKLNMKTLGGAPRAVAGPNGSIDVFWWGVDGQLWNATTDGSTWRGPNALGGRLASDPSPVASANGVLEVLWKGTNNNLWHQRYEPASGWSGAQDLRMSGLVGPPRAVSDAAGDVDVFWRGAGDELIQAYLVVGQGWQGPLKKGGQLATEPAPTIAESGLIRVFWRGKDGTLGQHWYTGGEWHGPQNTTIGDISGSPVALGRSNGEIELFWLDGGRQLWHAYWTPTTQWIAPTKVS